VCGNGAHFHENSPTCAGDDGGICHHIDAMGGTFQNHTTWTQIPTMGALMISEIFAGETPLSGHINTQ
jgi:hypothetical protein